MATAVRVYRNPSDRNKGYVLWSNGYINAIGGALQVEQREASVNEHSDLAPTFYQWAGGEANIARALAIIDWTVPSGYTLTAYGHVWAWGGVATVPGAFGGTHYLTTGPEFYFGLNGGVARPQYGWVNDFKMDPLGNGRGYMVHYHGDVIAFGTGVTAVAHNNIVSDTVCRQLQLDWTSKRYWVLDSRGRIWGRNGGNNVGIDGLAALTVTPGFEGRGFRLYDFSANPRGWMVDPYGRVHYIGAAAAAPGYYYNVFFPADIWEDLEIIDDGTGANSARLVELSRDGGTWEYVVSTPPRATLVEPVDGSTIVSSSRPYIGWTHVDRQNNPQKSYQLKLITSAVYTSGATSEVQRLTPSGTISGGTFQIVFDEMTTDAIVFNASAATIQAALEALPNIGTGGVVCAGGPINSAFVSITFQNHLSHWNWPQVTIISALTGTTPLITPSTTTAGVGIDPNVAANVFSLTGTEADVRRVRVTSDIANGTYRAYVRTTDSTDQTSSWDFNQFVLSYTALNAATLTLHNIGGLGGVRIGIDAATGGGLPGTARFGVQYHDSDWNGTTWLNVRDGYGLVPDGSGDATVTDYEPRPGVVRTYRAFTYVHDTANDDWNSTVSANSPTVTPTPRIWTLIDPYAPTTAIEARVQSFKRMQRQLAGVFAPVGREDIVVITDGAPKLPRFSLDLWLLDAQTRSEVETMFSANRTLLLRDPFGGAWYLRAIEDIEYETMRATPIAGEVTPIRNAHTFKAMVQTVKRPVAGPTTGPLAEVS